MRFRRIITVITVLSLARLIAACCNCPTTNNFEYRSDSFTVAVLNNAGASPVVVANQPIPKEALGLRLDFELIQIVYNRTKGSISSAAYAECFCGPGVLIAPTDTISSLTITTLNDFNTLHPANTDVTEYFSYLEYSSHISIPDYLRRPDTVYSENLPRSSSIDFFLLTAPTATGDYRFKIDIILSNQQTLTVVTDVVSLN